MGVRGLGSFLKESAPHLGRQIELQNIRLVIDGNNLCYYLYEVGQFDRRYGGQYEEFYDKVLSFFDALKDIRVESFVVIDGAFDKTNKKLETRKTRARQDIERSKRIWDGEERFLAPLMTKSVFIQALGDPDRDIKFAVSDCEADRDIAALASELKCPVLSNDTDFLITAKYGWIRLSTLFPSKSPDFTEARVFYPSEFAQHFNICEALLPLFVSLKGNDYVSEEVLKPFKDELERKIQLSDEEKQKHIKEQEFWRLAKSPSFSSSGGTVEHALSLLKLGESSKELEDAVQFSLDEYTVGKSNLTTYFQHRKVQSNLKTQSDLEHRKVQSNLKTQSGLELDQKVLRIFREGKLSSSFMSGLTAGKVFLKFQVENQEEPSSNQCSLSLRQLVYFILSNEGRNVEKIEEWDRKGPDYEKQDITPQAGLNDDGKLNTFLEALDSKTDEMESLSEELICLVASLRYLSRNAQPQPLHLVAIICCFMKQETVRWKEYLEDLRSSPFPRFDKRAAQSFCQWQCVLRDAVQLNVVLHEPVKTPRIHETFNGPLAHKFLKEWKRGKLRDLIPSEQFERLKKLYQAVTDRSLEEDFHPNAASYEASSANRLATRNRFDLLSDVDED